MRIAKSLLETVAFAAALTGYLNLTLPALAQSAPPPQSQPTTPVVLPMEEPRFKGELGRTFQDQCVKEGLHRRFAIAPSSLMRALERMVGIAADRAGMARQYG